MALGFGNPVQGPRIVPFGVARTSRDILPNGRPAFRVTQRYNPATDAYFPGKPHLAIDIGNYYCGDKLLAMSGGWVSHLRDPNGALGIEVRHSSGYRTQLWHISKTEVPNGSYVRRGKLIARVGQSGLDIGGCHGHVAMIDPSGRYVDPWPMLSQNQ